MYQLIHSYLKLSTAFPEELVTPFLVFKIICGKLLHLSIPCVSGLTLKVYDLILILSVYDG